MRDAVQEVGSAVERIDNEARSRGVAFDDAAFLHQEAPVGPRHLQLVPQCSLSPLIGLGYEIGRALLGNLQVLDLAEIAAQARPRLARGFFHDTDQTGDGGHAGAILTRNRDSPPLLQPALLT